MRFVKYNSIFSMANHFVIDAPEPTNISYMWNFGSLLGICLVVQIISGVLLAMHYQPSWVYAFDSIESIMRDVYFGWYIRYMHANTASFFFIFIYIHIARGLYYGSYIYPRNVAWLIGVVMFIVSMATAFIGYVLPFGQMSLWGCTVITNLITVVPWLGTDIVEFIWGGFSVNNNTINRFFSIHFILPFILLALTIIHLIAIHYSGSNNPLGISSNTDRVPFSPYFIYKDIITVFIYIYIIGYIVFYIPDSMGHPDNYIVANPMVTPVSIVPEWYFLPFYAILRSIEWKLGGVLCMFGSIVILAILPVIDISYIRGMTYRPIYKWFYFIFISNFFILMFIGSMHVEYPYTIIGTIATIYYFVYFVIIIPVIGIIENTIYDIYY